MLDATDRDSGAGRVAAAGTGLALAWTGRGSAARLQGQAGGGPRYTVRMVAELTFRASRKAGERSANGFPRCARAVGSDVVTALG